MANVIQIGTFPPAEVASRRKEIRVTKADLNTWMMVALAMLVGAFWRWGDLFVFRRKAKVSPQGKEEVGHV